MARPCGWFTATESGAAQGLDEFAPRIHAKAFGTELTVCGLNASNMRKEWDEAFDRRHRFACPACATALMTIVVDAAQQSGAESPTVQIQDS